MKPVRSLVQLYADLERENAGPDTVAALAEWYARHHQFAAAQALDWAMRKGRRPFRFSRDNALSVNCDTWEDGWYWWATAPADGVDDATSGQGWGPSEECRLPRPLWRALPHSFDYDPAVFKEYRTLHAAYEALITAWRT